MSQSQKTTAAYIEHLAIMGDSSSVVVRSDVKNRAGKVVASKGEAFTRSCISKLQNAGFSDSEIIEFALFTHLLDAENLYSAIQKYFNSDTVMASIFIRLNQKKNIYEGCEYLCRFRSVTEYLTILAEQYPNLFEGSIFCAWFGATILRLNKASEEDVRHAFMAGMCHDVGFLHLDPKILINKEKLTTEQWSEVLQHPTIGSAMLKKARGFPVPALLAIEDHHENLDGSGYPNHKLAHEIGSIGQLLNLLVTVNAVYKKRLKAYKRLLRDVIPIIQMNSNTHLGDAGKIFLMVLKSMPEIHSGVVPKNLISQLIKLVQQRHKHIEISLEKLKKINSDIGFRHNNPELRAAQNAIIHIVMAISQSGIINEGYMRWLDEVEKVKIESAYKEIEDVFVMMQEVVYHLDKIKRQFRTLLESNLESVYLTALENGLAQLEQIITPAITEELSDYFSF